MKTKLKKLIKPAIVIVILLAVAFFVVRPFILNRRAPVESPVMQTVNLTKGDLVSSVSATGLVESDSVRQVNSTITYEITEVLAALGDTVSAGDLLCTLDTSELEREIEQTRESIANSRETARLTLEARQKTYNNSKYLIDNGLNTELMNANSSVDSAKADLEQKQKTHDNNQFLFSLGEASEQEVLNSQIALETAEAAYDKAVNSLAATTVRIEQDLQKAYDDVKSAQASYDSISTAQLDNLIKKLEDAKITAPADGTITVVNAVKGATSNGILFVIEDLNKLVIKTTVKEYDIHNVKTGQKVAVKTDATGDEEFSGEVTSIAPTAQKSATGDTVSSSDVVFDVTVNVSDPSGSLKVGMNARLNIITAEKNDVFTVPYDALSTGMNGGDVVFTIERQEDGPMIARAVEVIKGAENDFNVEISGDKLTEGMPIVSDASGIIDGAVISGGQPGQPGQSGGMGGPGGPGMTGGAARPGMVAIR